MKSHLFEKDLTSNLRIRIALMTREFCVYVLSILLCMMYALLLLCHDKSAAK